MSNKLFRKPEYYENRELSFLEFDYRVLSEARDKSLPLMERLKFLSITASNLDEFYMVRIASLKDMEHAGYTKPDLSGLTPAKQLDCISIKTHDLVKSQYSTYRRSLLPLLDQKQIHIISDYEKLSPDQLAYADHFFMSEVYPVLTPMAVDSSRPFPLLKSNSLNIAVLLKDKKKHKSFDFATVQVPGVLPRLISISQDSNKPGETYLLLEQLIQHNIQKLFSCYEIVCAYPYRIMRNADLTIDEEDAADLLIEIQKQLKKRKWGEVIRLEIEEGMDERLLKILKKELMIKKESDIFSIKGPLDLTFLMKLAMKDAYACYRYPIHQPGSHKDLPAGCNIFDQIQKKDILLHLPYQSFDPVIDFVKQAAKDPLVLAISMTLYRVSKHSPIIAALMEAAGNEKQVTVLVELKARFDEENNINWARKLEQAGCHVIYGLRNLKTHCKITLVVRKEENGIRRYVHLGTGNYNDSTAKLYTDLGLFTCQQSFGEDATAVFHMLSGYCEPSHWNKLTLAPLWLKEKFLNLIQREITHAKEQKIGRLIAKINSLCDPVMIAALYEANAAGVEIQLIVRGICCLKTGIPGISDHIEVHSIVGNYLEHSRIFYFYNNGSSEVYLSSADWMPRNLDRRVEIMFPVEDTILKQEVITLLTAQWNDNVKTHVLQADGTYVKIDKRGKKLLNSQDYFCTQKWDECSKEKHSSHPYLFEPCMHRDK